MKIALITAKGAERFYADQTFDEIEKLLHHELIFLMEDMEWMPNLGLLTLAGVIDPSHQLVYIDEEYLSKETMDKLLYDESFDLVCISVINAQYKRSYEIADIYRKRGIPVAMGGIHPTALPEESLEHCDFLFIGEAEGTFQEFLKDFEMGKAKRIYKPTQAVDLTKVPPPRFDLMKQFDYYKKYNRFPIQGTRGCPRQCDFCFLPRMYGPKHRHKSVDQVIKEVEMVKEIVDEPFISFTDENMLLDLEYALELAYRMKEQKVLWECYCDISVAKHDELLKALYESHCVLLLIGFETLNPENFKDTNPWKYSQMRHYRESIEKIQSYGLGISGLFIVGFDNDTEEVFKHIEKFAIETGLIDVEVSALCPFPGTPFYRRMDKEGRILTKDWSKYTWIHMNFQPMKMKSEDVISGLFRLFKKMANPHRLLKQKKYFKGVARRLYRKKISKTGKPSFLSMK